MVAALLILTLVVRICILAVDALAGQLTTPVKEDIEPPSWRLFPEVSTIFTMPGPVIGLVRVALLPTMPTFNVLFAADSVIVPVPAEVAELLSVTVEPGLIFNPP